MKLRSDFLRWLSTKMYQVNIGMYLTIATVMSFPTVFTKLLGTPPYAASFCSFFIVSFIRAAYESLVVYQAPIKSLSPRKMIILSFALSCIMSFVSIFLKPKLGYFSIPIALVISMLIISKLKTALWPATTRTGFFAELPAILQLVPMGRYGFFGFLAGISYVAYGKYGFNFYYTFTVAYFIGTMFEELYNLHKIYEQSLNIRSIVLIAIWAAFCAITSVAIVMVMMQNLGYTCQAATIASVVCVKMVQPLGLRKLIQNVY